MIDFPKIINRGKKDIEEEVEVKGNDLQILIHDKGIEFSCNGEFLMDEKSDFEKRTEIIDLLKKASIHDATITTKNAQTRNLKCDFDLILTLQIPSITNVMFCGYYTKNNSQVFPVRIFPNCEKIETDDSSLASGITDLSNFATGMRKLKSVELNFVEPDPRDVDLSHTFYLCEELERITYDEERWKNTKCLTTNKTYGGCYKLDPNKRLL